MIDLSENTTLGFIHLTALYIDLPSLSVSLRGRKPHHFSAQVWKPLDKCMGYLLLAPTMGGIIFDEDVPARF